MATERRRGALVPGLAVVFALCGAGLARAETREEVHSVQLHVHGSFSEGVGSIASHSYEANELGVDVIWWSDHDFRIGSYHHVTRFDFEDWHEPIDRGESWRFRPDRQREGQEEEPTSGWWPFAAEVKPARGGKGLQLSERRAPGGSAEFESEEPDSGERSLRVSAASPTAEFRSHLYSFGARRAIHRRPLASGVTIGLSIFPEELGPDASVAVEIALSEHPADAGEPFATQRLRYFLVEEETEPSRVGATFHIPLTFRPGRWNRYELPLTEDAIRGFPSIAAEDNSLHELSIGVASRRGARASARFDSLEIAQELTGAAAFERQRELIDVVAESHPGVRQLQGVEISYVGNHLNEFSLAPELLDYDALFRESDRPGLEPPIRSPKGFGKLVGRRAVEAVHARGGLVSYNHLFGIEWEDSGSRRRREKVLARLIADRLFGADILEVGCRARGGYPLEDHLWVWDELAKAGLRKIGTGVSDSHGGPDQRWRSAPNNFVSWIYAGSPARAHLLEGLRAGRVFFGDITLFDGKLDLRTDGGARMGDTVTSAAERAEVSIEIEGLAEGDRIDVIETGVRTRTYPANGSRFVRRHVLPLPADADAFLRVEVHDSTGRAKVFSNPIYFVRESSAAGAGRTLQTRAAPERTGSP